MGKIMINEAPGMNFDLHYYISGPMNGYPENNFPAFQKALDLCLNSGIMAISPHEIKHEGTDLQWQDYLRGDLVQMLLQCQGIILIPGWVQSKGARLELSVALALDWPAYYLNPESGIIVNMNKKELP